jgi:hypothetical protein
MYVPTPARSRRDAESTLRDKVCRRVRVRAPTSAARRAGALCSDLDGAPPRRPALRIPPSKVSQSETFSAEVKAARNKRRHGAERGFSAAYARPRTGAAMKHAGIRDDTGVGRADGAGRDARPSARNWSASALLHRLDEPTGLSLSMVASPRAASVSPGEIIVAPP